MSRTFSLHPASLLALGLAACGGEAAGQQSANGTAALPPVEATCGLNQFEHRVLLRINAHRAAGAVCGGTAHTATSALRWDNRLQHAAAQHADDMARHDFMAHASSDGRTLVQRAEAAGYGYTVLAENVAAGQRSVDSVFDSWMRSPEHCRNIMDTRVRDVAAACVRNNAGRFGLYWTLSLGSPR
jgi:uncharacterized protein YkwD